MFPSIAELQSHRRMVNSLGRNAPCWCGSGKKYKKCHRDRETQTPVTAQEGLVRFRRAFKQGLCFHPDAGKSTCKGDMIRAHTIRRSGDLKGIAYNGHVYNTFLHGKIFDDSKWDPESAPNLVGIQKASTFAGFCAWHDNQLFAPLEKEPFKASPIQIALLGYRSICYEIFVKDCELGLSDFRRDFDKGRPPLEQLAQQKWNRIYNAGLAAGVKELKQLRSQYQHMITNGRFDEIDHYVLEFGNRPEIVCSGTTQSTHDFRGRLLQDLADLHLEPSQKTFALLATDRGGAAVFSWPKGHRKTEQFIATMDELSDEELPHAILRFVFEFFENTYFSPEWWDNLERPVQIALRKRQLNGLPPIGGDNEFFRRDDCLLDDGIRAVDWPVVSRRLVVSPN